MSFDACRGVWEGWDARNGDPSYGSAEVRVVREAGATAIGAGPWTLGTGQASTGPT